MSSWIECHSRTVHLVKKTSHHRRLPDNDVVWYEDIVMGQRGNVGWLTLSRDCLYEYLHRLL